MADEPCLGGVDQFKDVIGSALFRLCDQHSRDRNGVLDQSYALMRAAISPPPVRKLTTIDRIADAATVSFICPSARVAEPAS
jgi:hypothetical protein